VGTPGLDQDVRTEGRPSRERRRARSAIIALVVVIVLLLAAMSVTIALLMGRDASTTTTAPSGTPTATSSPSQAEPVGTDALDDFIAAAGTLDAQLKTAAAAINAIGPPWDEVTAEVAEAVRTADFAPVAATIPAGLPDDMRLRVMTAYSDLVSRRAAMQTFAVPSADAEDGVRPSEALVDELANGAPAAARFPADLALVDQGAASTSGFSPAPATSREAAEITLLVRYVDTHNLGCDSRGGYVLTALPPIVWASVSTGTIGADPAVSFEARLTGDVWEVMLNAC
jgi:hypothetical protein